MFVVYACDVAPFIALVHDKSAYHWYEYDPKPPTGFAVSVTVCPESATVFAGVTDTLSAGCAVVVVVGVVVDEEVVVGFAVVEVVVVDDVVVNEEVVVGMVVDDVVNIEVVVGFVVVEVVVGCNTLTNIGPD